MTALHSVRQQDIRVWTVQSLHLDSLHEIMESAADRGGPGNEGFRIFAASSKSIATALATPRRATGAPAVIQSLPNNFSG